MVWWVGVDTLYRHMYDVNMFIVLCITARPFMPSELFNINCTYNLIFDIKRKSVMEKTYSLSHDLFPMRIVCMYVCRYGYNFTYVRGKLRYRHKRAMPQ